MGKTKPTQPAKVIKSKKDAEVKAISSVKEGAITKPSQTPKSKSKEIAKHVAVKAAKGDKKSKKAKKEPTPEPSSSEAESDEEMAGASSASSDESESEVEVPKKVIQANGSKVNGKSKPSAKVEVESSESSASSDEEDEDDSEDEEDEAKPAAPKSASAAPKSTPAATKLTPAAKVAQPKEESDSDAESGSSEGESEEESEGDEEDESDDEGKGKPKAKGPVDAKALNGALTKVASEQVIINPCRHCPNLSCLLSTLVGIFSRKF